MDHVIEIKLAGNAVKPVMPDEKIKVGDTLRFFSLHPKFRVEIEHGSPFEAPTTLRVEDSEKRPLIREGTFFCKCFVTPKGMQEIGWSKEHPESGGSCIVDPNHP